MDSEGLQSVTESGQPVRRRVSNAAVAQQIYADFVESGLVRVRRLLRVKGVVDGNAPFDQAELVRLGQSWRANFSTREARNIINQSVAASWELHWEVPTLIETTMSPVVVKALNIKPEDAVGWCKIVDEEYSRLLQNWDEFYGSTWQSTHDMFTFGFGGMLWQDKLDWRPKALRALNIKLPDRSPHEVNNMEILQLDDEKTVSQMFQDISNEAQARAAGWNVTAVRQLLVRVYRGGEQQADGSRGEMDWGALQRNWVEGVADVQRKEHETVKLVQTLVKEFDGTTWSITRTIHAKDLPDVPFVYEKKGEFRKMSEAAWFLFYECGDSTTFHSIKGLGHELFAFAEYSNRFLCQGFDAGLIAASLLVKARQGGTGSLDILRLGPVTLLPADVELQQANNFAPAISHLMQLRGLQKDILHNNTGVFRPNSEQFSDSEVQKTARQIVSEEGKEARFEKNKAVMFYIQWQRWHREIFRRVTNPELLTSTLDLPGKGEAVDFAERCAARGVPLALLARGSMVFDVQVSQAVGLGSVGAKMDLTNQLMGATGRMDEVSRRYVERQWAATRVGWRNVDRIFPLRGPETVTQAENLAEIENNDFREGRPLPVGSDQEHPRHVVRHERMLISFAQQFKEAPDTMDVQQAAATFEVTLQHIEAHLEKLAGDPTREMFLNEHGQLFEELARVGKALMGAAQKIDQSQQRVHKAGQELVAKAAGMVADQKLDIERMVAQGKLQIESEKQNSINDIRLMREQVQQQLKTQKQQFDQALKVQQQQFDQQLALLAKDTGSKK